MGPGVRVHLGHGGGECSQVLHPSQQAQQAPRVQSVPGVRGQREGAHSKLKWRHMYREPASTCGGRWGQAGSRRWGSQGGRQHRQGQARPGLRQDPGCQGVLSGPWIHGVLVGPEGGGDSS